MSWLLSFAIWFFLSVQRGLSKKRSVRHHYAVDKGNLILVKILNLIRFVVPKPVHSQDYSCQNNILPYGLSDYSLNWLFWAIFHCLNQRLIGLPNIYNGALFAVTLHYRCWEGPKYASAHYVGKKACPKVTRKAFKK